MSYTRVYFSLFYVVFTICLIFRPTEFESAGLTVEHLFQKWLGSENELFIQYHVKLTALNIFLHSLLPLGYIVGLQYAESYNNDRYFDFHAWSRPGQVLIISSCIIPVVTGIVIWYWYQNNWSNHPINRKLLVYTTPETSWLSVASDINIEFRRVDKISIQSSSVVQVVATDNWVMKVSPYSVDVAHQSDTALILSSADVHQWSPHINDNVQFVNIDVKPTRRNATPFKIRLNAVDLKDLQNRISRPITILGNVRVHRSLTERFVETFAEEIARNPTYRTSEELDACIGCMQVPANVKLHKMCDDSSSPREHCANCHCRPMWCVDCMGRWFASRQENEPNTWLSSKCSCPLCRARFCILDVLPVAAGL